MNALSFKESKKEVFQNAIDVASELLRARLTRFKFARTEGESKNLLAFKCKKWSPLEVNIGGIPLETNLLRMACVFQALHFMTEEQIALSCKYLCELGDRFFYDEGQPDLALKSFQLAAGFDGTYEEAIWGVLTVCLQSNVPTEIALPYSIVMAEINPKKDEVDYVIQRIELERPLFLETYFGEKIGLKEKVSWFTAGGNEKRTGYVPSAISSSLKLKWIFEDAARITGGIAVAHNVVVFGDVKGKLYGIDFRSGKKLWERQLKGKHFGTPTIAHGKVITGLSNRAFCFDLKTGEELWRLEEQIDDPYDISNYPFASYGCPVSIYQYAVFCDDRLTIYEAKSGQRIVNQQLGFETTAHAGPCFDNIYFYLPAGRSLWRFSIITHKIEDLPFYTNGKITAGPIIQDDIILFGTNRSRLEAVKLSSMKNIWSFAIEEPSKTTLGYIDSRPAAFRDHVVFGGPDGNVYNIDLSSGQKKWKTTLNYEIESPIIISNEKIFVLSCDGTLHVLDLEEGKVLWAKQISKVRDVASAPAIYKDHLLVGVDKLYCLNVG